jgi:hypothetical protein
MSDRRQATLRVESHMLPALRAAFADGVQQLRSRLRVFAQDGFIAQPWMGDPLTKALTVGYNARAVDGPGSAYECLLAYETELVKIRDQLTQMEAGYHRHETDVAASFGRQA